MSRCIEAVIFDWAGTTVDYGCFAPVQAFVEVFKHFGIEPTMDEVREPMGMLKIDHIRTMLSMPRIHDLWVKEHGSEPSEDHVLQMYDLFESKLMSILDQFTTLKPYVTETVEFLRQKNIKIGSTTGYTDTMMEVVTKGAKEQGYEPDAWFSPDSTEGIGRPYPYMIFKNLEGFHGKKCGEDRRYGFRYQRSTACGCHFCGCGGRKLRDGTDQRGIRKYDRFTEGSCVQESKGNL